MGCAPSISDFSSTHSLRAGAGVDGQSQWRAVAEQVERERGKKHIIVGVFGLRDSGKTTLLHTIRRHQNNKAIEQNGCVPPPPPSGAFLPLVDPTDSVQLFTGMIVNGEERHRVTCIDTPGMAPTSALRHLFPHLDRIVWVVDSTSEKEEWDLSIIEAMNLWRDVTSYFDEKGVPCTLPPPRSLHDRSESDLLRRRSGGGAAGMIGAGSSRKLTGPGGVGGGGGTNGSIPTMHIVFTKQNTPQTTTTTTTATTATATTNVPTHTSTNNLLHPPQLTSSSSSSSSQSPTASDASVANCWPTALSSHSTPTSTPIEIANYMSLPSLLPHATIHGFSCCDDDPSRIDRLIQQILGLNVSSFGSLAPPPGTPLGGTRRSPNFVSQQFRRRRSIEPGNAAAAAAAIAAGTSATGGTNNHSSLQSQRRRRRSIDPAHHNHSDTIQTIIDRPTNLSAAGGVEITPTTIGHTSISTSHATTN